ncbi:MAG: RloB family protein [Candidatus Thiodiazotropha sp.]|nr:MAG: CRISPR-associated protein [gamma proteobacterium symbiont of Ctena orbiculata]
MGSDDLFHKRKHRTKESLCRKKVKREPYDVVLIVCEGEKTEPYYFEELRDALGLHRDNIQVTGECGSSPKSVVNEALRLFDLEPDFDAVFCVFDRDMHEDYSAALERISARPLNKRQGKRSVGKARFEAITSVPCFEYWLLLHFHYTTHPYTGSGTKSPCDHVLDELKVRGIPDYEKGIKGWHERTRENLDTANHNAIRALAAAEAAGTDNPTTLVHELVSYLQDLSEQQKK